MIYTWGHAEFINHYTITSQINLNGGKCEVIHTQKNRHTLTIHIYNDRIYSNIATQKNFLQVLWIALYHHHVNCQQQLKRQTVSLAGQREHNNIYHWALASWIMRALQNIWRRTGQLLIACGSPRFVFSSSKTRSYPFTNSLQNHEWRKEHFLTK